MSKPKTLRVLPLSYKEVKDWEVPIKKWLKKAADRVPNETDTAQRLIELAKKNRVRILIVHEAGTRKVWAVAALEKIKARMHVTAIGGRGMGSWLMLLEEEIEMQARLFRKEYLTGRGRDGWQKVLKGLGWVLRPDGMYFKRVGAKRGWL